MDCHPQFQAQKADLYHQSLNIFIQCHFSKLFFINEFYFSSDEQSLGNGLGPLNELFLGKLDINITKDKKNHVKDHFHINFGQ